MNFLNNLNSVLVEGVVADDPMLKAAPNEETVLAFTIANSRFNKTGTGVEQEVSFFEVEARGEVAESCGNTAKKGRVARVVGRLKQEPIGQGCAAPYPRVFIIAEHIELKPVPANQKRLVCDRCGKDIEEDWHYGEGPVCAGNCTGCGDNLCRECAGSWDDDGCCQDCQQKENEKENRNGTNHD